MRVVTRVPLGNRSAAAKLTERKRSRAGTEILHAFIIVVQLLTEKN
jgi:hypothetical protein